MNKGIHTYDDLIREKQQLEVLLQAQKELIVYDLGQIKKELEPAATALNFLGRITTRDKSNLLLSEGANKVIDLVFKKLILARAGWLTRLTVPFLIKNYSSHFITENKQAWMKKLFSWVSHKNGKAKAAPEPTQTRED